MFKNRTATVLLTVFSLLTQLLICEAAAERASKKKEKGAKTEQTAQKSKKTKEHSDDTGDEKNADKDHSIKKASHSEKESSGPNFTDATATITNKENVTLGHLVFIGPFATLKAGADQEHAIEIGSESNVQDRVTLDAAKGKIKLGEQVILAHGATVKGSASIGEKGSCPKGKVCPSFVSFNAEVDGATIEKDAMVSALARVAPGVTIPSGRSVLPGKNVATQAEVESKTAAVTEADREFMHGVIEVNVAFARGYTKMAAEDASYVRGCQLRARHQL